MSVNELTQYHRKCDKNLVVDMLLCSAEKHHQTAIYWCTSALVRFLPEVRELSHMRDVIPAHFPA